MRRTAFQIVEQNNVKLVLIHQSEEKAGDMQQAWEQPGVRLRAYDAWAMDPEALDDCRQALLQCDFAVILLHGGLSWFPDFQKLFYSAF